MTHENAITIRQFEDVKNDIAELRKTVYTGNGEPGLVSRMTAVEKSINTLVKFGWIAITAMLTTAGLIVADLITRHARP